jgi:hypothetical protein
LQKNFFVTGEENCSLYWIVGTMVWAHLRWGMLRVLLGVYHTLMWDRILQYSGGGGVVARIVVVPAEGQVVLGRGKAPRVFDELGANRLETILRKVLEE